MRYLLYLFDDCEYYVIVRHTGYSKELPRSGSIELLEGGYKLLSDYISSSHIYGYSSNFEIKELDKQYSVSELEEKYPEYFL